jgi:hypothetical protein
MYQKGEGIEKSQGRKGGVVQDRPARSTVMGFGHMDRELEAVGDLIQS